MKFFRWSACLMVLGLAGRAFALDAKIISPSDAKVEIRMAADRPLAAVIAVCPGRPLPAEKTIVAELRMPATATALTFPLENYFWTEPWWMKNAFAAKAETEFILWYEPTVKKWAALLPLAGGGCRSMMEGGGDCVRVIAESFDGRFAPGRVPLVAGGLGDDPYQLVPDLFAFAFDTMRAEDAEHITGRLRAEKPFPELFRYLGWCSWNAHYRWVTAEDLYQHGASFQAAGFPVGWMLIDDGWQTMQKEMYNRWSNEKMYMTSFAANGKFPGGLAETTRRLKQDYGVRGVGVWHTFQGYWNGFALDSDLGRAYRDALLPYSPEAAIPDPRSDAGARIWEDWYALLAGSGVDFTKVDNQSRMAEFTRDVLPVTHAMAQGQRNIQAASERHMNLTLIDCMEMRTDVIYQWGKTNIGRTSNDFVPFFTNNPRSHVMKNVMNAFWFGNLLWPDYDMFQSHVPHAAYHAVARAIAGGPVYTTDKAGQEKWEVLWPLILSDGLLLRPDAPGLPARQSLLRDPRTSHTPFVAFARAGEGGALALWNLDRLRLPVRGTIGPGDIEGLAGERFAVHEYFSGKTRVLAAGESMRVWLWGWGTRIYSMWPVKGGFAPVGLVDKYFPAATVAGVEQTPAGVTVKLGDGGPFLAWCEREPGAVRVNGADWTGKFSWREKLLRLDLPRRPRERTMCTVEIDFRRD